MAMVWKVLTRKKVIDPVSAEQSQLSRVLNTFDLTALGVGSTLGVGVYVLAGHVARDVAGPAVILSFLLAAIASVFAGLCYAEFGARAPRAGSAYIYSYVCVGEFVAFVIGWNLILEYVIGSASVARGLSLYLDTLINSTLQDTFMEIAPINVPYLSKYFDFFAFGVSLLLATALAFGMKESSLVNNIFTVINIFVVGFVIIAGSLKADPANWSISPDTNATNATEIGNGGFFPFGIEGMIKGAATCFYGFVGFDCIATTGEEVKNPKRAIPISIILSLFIIFVAYFGTSTVITLMVPYYLQDPDAPIPYAFEHIGWYTAKWIVSIGGIFGLCASLFGAMFPLPRIVYAMASDSLVFKFLGKVNSRFQTPVVGTLLAGLLTGLMAALFDLAQLVNMMSIGTLLAYTIVAASVLLLRYTENKTYNNSEDATTSDEQELLQHTGGSTLAQIFNCGRHTNPTKTSEMIVAVEVFIYCVICILMGLCAIYLRDYIGQGEIWAIVLTSLVVFVAVFIIMSIVTQPTSNKELSFKVPLVPLIPALSILVNIYLMLMLDTHTWIRFAVWMAIGLPIYYFSVRPYTEAQNKNVSNKSSIDYNVTMVHNKQNGKVNGINNKAFINDEDVPSQLSVENEHKNSKKKAAPQPPAQANGIIDNEIPAEITRLDEILEAAASSIDDSVIERKLSVDTVSNMSDFVPHEENVVADVHRDNVITPANSKAPSFSSYKKDSFSDSNEQSYLNLDSKIDYKSLENDSKVASDIIMQNEVQKEAPDIDNIQTLEDLPSPVVEKNAPVEDEIVRDNDSESIKNATTERSSNVSFIPTPPPSPTSPILKTKEEKTDRAPVPPPILTPMLSVEEVKAIVRPTSSNLRSVTLRPTKQREELKQNNRYEPGEDNLKVGSDKYKHFLQNLSGKLQNMNVVPNYMAYIKTPSNKPLPKNDKEEHEPNENERKPNENVLEDNINKIDAMEKLGSFISDPSRNRGILGNINLLNDIPAVNNEEKNEQNVIKNNDEKNSESPEDDDKISNSTSDSDFMEHKDRMQNVFRSMNLKKADSLRDPDQVESRNVKSLGPSFLDDKSKHRQAMGEIFKSIEQRRSQDDGD